MKPKIEHFPKKSPMPESLMHPIPSKEDPMGSYTGVPLDEYDVPVQDVDDL